MTAALAKRTLRAGVGRGVITPPVGIRMLGYTVQEGCSQSVERDLTATALVLTNGHAEVVLIACDVVFIPRPHVDRMRERIGRRLDIPPAHVLINASHTHLGPMFPGWQQEPPEQQQIQDRYVAFLEETLTGLAAVADSKLQPARLGAGKGTAALGINRRERLPDGRVIIGENPAGAVDHDVGVLRVDDLDGKPLATVMIAGCHTVVLGPKTLSLSPDFVGPARQIVESATGAPCLFLQGAAGNVNPVCGIGGGPAQWDDLARLGALLAGETLKTWAGIRTHNRRGPRRIIQSVATVSVWDYEPLPAESVEVFGVATRRLTLPLAALPDRDTAQRQLAERRRDRDEARARGASPGPLNVAQRLVEWAEVVAAAVAEGTNPIIRDVDLWALRLNDIGIVAVSGEPFAELSLEVKRRSPLPHSFFLGYSNGCLGYLPTPAAFGEGGMEVEESVRNYNLPAALTPAWGPAIVQAALQLLARESWGRAHG
jgi:hypothetical protein